MSEILNDEEIIKIFKETKTIAIVGLSPNEEKPSNRVGVYLQKAGYKIIPIYPKEETILGEKVYRSLEEVKERVDMVDMFRKGEFASVLLEQIRKRDDVKYFWLQLGITNESVKKEANKLGLHFVQDKCTKIEHERVKDKIK